MPLEPAQAKPSSRRWRTSPRPTLRAPGPPEEIGKFGGLGGLGPVAVGCSPATIADELERWVAEADVDGFNLAYAITPGTFVDFIDLVVPELQRRGLVWEDYAGNTLRESVYGPGPPTRRPPGRAVPYPPDVGAQTRNLGDLTASAAGLRHFHHGWAP